MFVKTNQMESLEFVHFTVCESYPQNCKKYWILVGGIYVEALKVKYTDVYNLFWNIFKKSHGLMEGQMDRSVIMQAKLVGICCPLCISSNSLICFNIFIIKGSQQQGKGSHR